MWSNAYCYQWTEGMDSEDNRSVFADGKYIAVGSHDNFIYIYTVSEDGRTYRRHGKLSVSIK